MIDQTLKEFVKAFAGFANTFGVISFDSLRPRVEATLGWNLRTPSA